MKKLLIALLLLTSVLSYGQHLVGTDVKLVNGSSSTAGTTDGTAYFDTGIGAFQFRQSNSWLSLNSSVFTISTKTTNYTLTSTDVNSVYIQANSSSNINITVPTDASGGWTNGGWVIPIKAVGTGGVTIIASGTTITASNTTLGLVLTQGMVGTLVRTGTNTWEFDNGTAVVGNAVSITNNTFIQGVLSGNYTNSSLAPWALTLNYNGSLPQSNGGVGSGGVASATTGTISVDFTNTGIFTITPTGDCTFNLSGAEYTGQETVVEITTSGTTSYKITFGTGFNSQGVISTGTTNGATITITFHYDGSSMTETSRSWSTKNEIISTVSTYANYTTSATYQAITSITLTPGDWDLSAFFTYSSNSATITAAANAVFVISTTSASASGATEGLNMSYVPQAALLGTSKFTDVVAPYQVSPSANTTYYLNTQATFTVGNPQYVGTIRAVKRR